MSNSEFNNAILLSGEVNLAMFKHLLYSLPKVDFSKPVEISLNTEGGDPYQGFAIYDRLKLVSRKTPVYITCEGPVMSSGLIILQSATKRYMMPNSYIMIHYGEEEINSSQSKAHSNELDRRYRKLISERATVGNRTIHNWMTKDYYFNSEHALKVGLIDEVL